MGVIWLLYGERQKSPSVMQLFEVCIPPSFRPTHLSIVGKWGQPCPHTHTFLHHIRCSTYAVLSISYLFTGSQYAGKCPNVMWATLIHTHWFGLNWCWTARRPWPGYNLTGVALWVNILRASWVTLAAVTSVQHKSNKTVLTGVGVFLWLYWWENLMNLL